jgi:hypothetical protein
MEGSEFLARAVQHETDHLDGILFIDRLDSQARKAAMKLIRESPTGPAAERPVVRTSPACHLRAGAVAMRLVFAGTPAVAIPSLEALIASRHEVVAVLTRPDAPAGSGPVHAPLAGPSASRGSTAYPC